MAKRVVIGVCITSRVKDVPVVQQILSEYGCNIRTRLGMHEVAGEYCAASGVVLLDMVGSPAEIDACQAKLTAVEGVQCQRLEFDV